MRICSYSIFLILILLFIGCDTKDILKVALEKQIEELTQQNIDLAKLKNDLSEKVNGLLEKNKDLAKLKNDLSEKVNGLLEENKDLRRELETYKNRIDNTANKMFR